MKTTVDIKQHFFDMTQQLMENHIELIIEFRKLEQMYEILTEQYNALEAEMMKEQK